MTDFDLEAT